MFIFPPVNMGFADSFDAVQFLIVFFISRFILLRFMLYEVHHLSQDNIGT
jgi:hypothetical protein